MIDIGLKSNNHYVSQFYLKNWSDTHGKIWAYRILAPNEKMAIWKHSSPAALAYHKHLYTRMLTSGYTDEFENWLNDEFESPAASVIQKAISNVRLTYQDWEILIKYLAAQDVRTPARLSENLKRWPEILTETMEKSIR